MAGESLGYAVVSVYEDDRRPFLGYAYSTQENAADAAATMIAGPGERFIVAAIIGLSEEAPGGR
jgi:hypothetical protein